MFLLINYYDPATGNQGEIVFRECFFRDRWSRERERQIAKIRKITVRKEIVDNDACRCFRFID